MAHLEKFKAKTRDPPARSWSRRRKGAPRIREPARRPTRSTARWAPGPTVPFDAARCRRCERGWDPPGVRGPIDVPRV